jgi:hypothetical protein
MLYSKKKKKRAIYKIGFFNSLNIQYNFPFRI